MKVQEIWQKYVQEQSPADLSVLNPNIRASWLRCSGYAVNPDKTEMKMVSPVELQHRRQDAQELLNSALPYLHKLFKIIDDDESVITLADHDAVVIEVLASDLMKAMPSFPVQGSVHSEDVVGTNGIGTSLVQNAPIQLRGCEHWLRVNQNWVCNSAPIRIGNHVTGCINLASPMTGTQHAHTLGLVVSTTNAIEREIMLKRVLSEKQMIVQQQKAILEVVDTGIIAIDRSGNITQINQQALDVFKVTGAWEGRHIGELIDSGFDFIKLISQGEMLDERDLSVKIGNGHWHVCFSTFRINLDSIGIGMVIRVRALGAVRNIVNRISGSHAYYRFEDFIGASEAMVEPMRIGRVASKNTTNILLQGETGTGKELMAQAIHNASDRRSKPFVAVNCGAFSRELIQSELFGYEGGAFTGAKSGGSLGKFELADGGTLFLDEIGEMPLEAQANLLRVLQTRQVMRLGAKFPVHVDVRIISATNRDLEQAVQEVTFRGDLYYRLNVLSIHLPPLRERKSDIPLLTDHLFKKLVGAQGDGAVRISDEVRELFNRYSWPGNVRELENVLQRAVVMCENGVITLKEIPLAMRQQDAIQSHRAATDSASPALGQSSLNIGVFACDHLIKVLMETKGNLRRTSELLNVSRGTVYNMITRYKLNIEDYR